MQFITKILWQRLFSLVYGQKIIPALFEFSLPVLNFPVGLYFPSGVCPLGIGFMVTFSGPLIVLFQVLWYFSSGLITEGLLHGVFSKDISRRELDFSKGIFQGEIKFSKGFFPVGNGSFSRGSFSKWFFQGIFPRDWNCSFSRGFPFFGPSYKIPFLLNLCNHLYHHKYNTYKPNYRGHYPSYTGASSIWMLPSIACVRKHWCAHYVFICDEKDDCPYLLEELLLQIF